jgi:hypothetical protein
MKHDNDDAHKFRKVMEKIKETLDVKSAGV